MVCVCESFWCWVFWKPYNSTVTSSTLLQNGVKFRLVTGRDITAALQASRKTHKMFHLQIILSKQLKLSLHLYFLLPELLAQIWALLAFCFTEPCQMLSLVKEHELTRACSMAKDTWRLAPLWCSRLCLTTVECDDHSMGEPSARLPRVFSRGGSRTFLYIERASKLLP